MQVPNFLKLDGEALLFNLDDQELIFYVPEVYFDATTKNPIAQISGDQVSMIGLCNYAFVDKNGKRGPIKLFSFPTMMLCKPYTIDKEKALQLDKNYDPMDYRLLRFKKGDEVVSQVRVPKIIDNAELLLKMMVITAKLPNSIPYDKIWELFYENAKLNGFSYNLSVQIFWILIGTLCRDPKDLSKPFRLTSMDNMNDYKLVSTKLVAKYISPYTAITSENFDDGVRAAVLMNDMPEDKIPYSPLEKIITM